MENVQVRVGNRIIEGVVCFRNNRGVGVRIEKPFVLSTSVSRPLFLTGSLTLRGWDGPDILGPISHELSKVLEERDSLGKYGDSLIEQFLIDLDSLARFIEQNRDALIEAYARVREAIEDLPRVHTDYPTFLRKRRELRSRFRSGELDKKEHQKLRRLLRKDHEAIGYKTRVLQDAFMDAHLPEPLRFCCQRDELAKALES